MHQFVNAARSTYISKRWQAGPKEILRKFKIVGRFPRSGRYNLIDEGELKLEITMRVPRETKRDLEELCNHLIGEVARLENEVLVLETYRVRMKKSLFRYGRVVEINRKDPRLLSMLEAGVCRERLPTPPSIRPSRGQRLQPDGESSALWRSQQEHRALAEQAKLAVESADEISAWLDVLDL